MKDTSNVYKPILIFMERNSSKLLTAHYVQTVEA